MRLCHGTCRLAEVTSSQICGEPPILSMKQYISTYKQVVEALPTTSHTLPQVAKAIELILSGMPSQIPYIYLGRTPSESNSSHCWGMALCPTWRYALHVVMPYAAP